MSTARRPQTDGLSERSNETMQLLRCYACETDNQWVDALPLVEFCFNNAVNELSRTHRARMIVSFGGVY